MTRRSAGDLKIGGFKEPSTARVKNIVETDLNDLKAKILQDQEMLKAMPGNIDPEVMNKVLIPKIIREVYPNLDEAEVEEVRQHVVDRLRDQERRDQAETTTPGRWIPRPASLFQPRSKVRRRKRLRKERAATGGHRGETLIPSGKWAFTQGK